MMEQGLIKGPWSQEEDKILNEYVKTYGPKNWNGLQRLTGLRRDGKSCRLRWLNHLNPSLKKGKFSEEEKQKILQLRQLGYKWSKIAEQIPGRTDNEIKNFYNINERKKRKMENDNGEGWEKKKKIMWNDNESNDSGECSNIQQQDISNTHEIELMKDSFHVPIMQPSNMLCNNVASTSIDNSSPTLIHRGKPPIMPVAMVTNLPYSHTYIRKNSSPTIIDRGEGRETPFMPAPLTTIFNLPPLPESLNFQSNKSLLHSHPSIRKNSSPKIIDRGEAPFIPMTMVSNLPPLPKSLNFQSNKSPLHSHPSISKNSSPKIIDRCEAPFMPMTMVSNLPPLPESLNFQSNKSPFHSHPSIRKNSSPKIIDRCEAPFMPMTMVSNLPPLSESLDFQSNKSPCHSHPSISKNSSPKIIDRGEAPFVPMTMVSNLPPLPESSNFQSNKSPLHSHPSISKNSSPTIIDRGEGPFMPTGMVSNLPPLLESIDLIQKYPPLSLRSSEEIQQERLKLDSPVDNSLLEPTFNTSRILEDSNGNMHSSETRLVDENEKQPTSLKKDESKSDDFIDVMDFILNASETLEDFNDNMHSHETRLVDENGKMPMSNRQDFTHLLEYLLNTPDILEDSNDNMHSNRDDLIDLVDGLGWLDGYIF